MVGKLYTFELRCDAKYAKFDFKPNAQYNIPPSWGHCELQMNAESGSVISVLQQ